jgi:SIR2-like domain
MLQSQLMHATPPDQAASSPVAPKVLELPTFLRMFQMRKGQIMWLLGAGASRAAGIKTAGDMIWEFKRNLYCSEKKQPLSVVSDLSDPLVRRKLQAHFDTKGSFPAAGAEDEYAHYFETTYPSPKDRRAYIEREIKEGKPSFGHFAIALLMQKGFCRAAWATNFDRTVEDAASRVMGSTGALVVADLAEPKKIRQAWSEERWPTYGKLHGDYHSDRLKNTAAELREQDADMRACLVDGCNRYGLAVVGYSGRDASIIEALTTAVSLKDAFPGGFFWFKRFQDQLYPGVTALIAVAQAEGIDAHVIEVETFDELFADILRFLPETEHEIGSVIGSIRPRLAKATPRLGSNKVPVIRTNALPVISYPAICRLIVCEIGGSHEVQTAVEQSGLDVVAMRVKPGVLAFGCDNDIRRVFEQFKITGFETHAIAPAQLVAPTGTRWLIRDALFRALIQRPGITALRRGTRQYLLPNPAIVKSADFHNDQCKPIDRLSGAIGTVTWTEACGFRLDYRFDQLWLLLEPRVLLDLDDNTPVKDAENARDFVRERRARRRNREANAILDGWTRLIVGDDQSIRIRAFDIADGHDAEFEISRVTGFSGVAP